MDKACGSQLHIEIYRLLLLAVYSTRQQNQRILQHNPSVYSEVSSFEFNRSYSQVCRELQPNVPILTSTTAMELAFWWQNVLYGVVNTVLEVRRAVHFWAVVADRRENPVYGGGEEEPC